MAEHSQRIAIIGGGFSGAMLAARLAEAGVASTVVDRTGDFGRGAAYSTDFDGHVLNVRSNRMSARADRPDDFVRWLEAHAPDHTDPQGFTPRALYGRYVRDRLESACAAAPGLIETVVGEVTAIEGSALRLADGRRIEADAVVLATGNPAPKTAGATAAEDRIIADPWAPGALDRIEVDDDVLILGAGLTMVDVMLWLEARGWGGRAIALSRRGLKPRAHGAEHDAPIPPSETLTSGTASARLAEARRLASGGDWRGVMEGLRPITAELWAKADSATRGRLLRHLRPWWDVHRHRIAPGVAEALEALEADGRLEIVAGRVAAVEEDVEGVSVRWRPRRGTAQPPLTGRWLIDCTGPGHDVARDPLVGPLIDQGRARLDPLKLGLDLDAQGRVLHADGTPDAALFALGPPARAAFWETVAVPDIRKRIEDLAETLVETLAGAPASR